MREAFGAALLELADRFEELVVLDSDNATSTHSQLMQQRYPDRFVNVGIAEQNMVGIAAGMALAGARPIACAFASMLVNRGLDQIRHSVAHPGAPVVLAGHYAGLSGAREGACHHATADIAALRAIPQLRIAAPGCDTDVLPVLEAALRAAEPSYVRLSRERCPPLPAPLAGSVSDGFRFYGDPHPRMVVVTGGAVTAAAVTSLRDAPEGTCVVQLIDVAPVPFARLWPLLRSASYFVTFEEHCVVGGSADALLDEVSARIPIQTQRIGTPLLPTVSGSYPALQQLYGLTAANLLDHLHGMGARRSSEVKPALR